LAYVYELIWFEDKEEKEEEDDEDGGLFNK